MIDLFRRIEFCEVYGTFLHWSERDAEGEAELKEYAFCESGEVVEVDLPW